MQIRRLGQIPLAEAVPTTNSWQDFGAQALNGELSLFEWFVQLHSFPKYTAWSCKSIECTEMQKNSSLAWMNQKGHTAKDNTEQVSEPQ